MRCPKCGAKIKTYELGCRKCGLRMSEIKEASFEKVDIARAEYQPEKVVYSSFFPSDLSKKKVLLLCIFLGWAGGQYYSTKRPIRAILMTLASILFLLTSSSMALTLQGLAGFLEPLGSWMLGTRFYVFPCMFGALCVIVWILDIIKICTKTFKVPVVLPEQKQKENNK